jgi:hypothetical protein
VTQTWFLTWATSGGGPELIEQAGTDREKLMAEVASSETDMERAAEAFFGAWFAEAETIASAANPRDRIERATPGGP